jgi:replication initiation and membrane attachment protein DnaB
MQHNSGGAMSEVKELTRFYAAIREDHRIGTAHISLYMALFQFYNLNGFQNPVAITRAAVMEVAKISGLATYHRCMKDLVELGYIEYQPSFHPGIGSKVILIYR